MGDGVREKSHRVAEVGRRVSDSVPRSDEVKIASGVLFGTVASLAGAPVGLIGGAGYMYGGVVHMYSRLLYDRFSEEYESTETDDEGETQESEAATAPDDEGNLDDLDLPRDVPETPDIEWADHVSDSPLGKTARVCSKLAFVGAVGALAGGLPAVQSVTGVTVSTAVQAAAVGAYVASDVVRAGTNAAEEYVDRAPWTAPDLDDVDDADRSADGESESRDRGAEDESVAVEHEATLDEDIESVTDIERPESETTAGTEWEGGEADEDDEERRQANPGDR